MFMPTIIATAFGYVKKYLAKPKVLIVIAAVCAILAIGFGGWYYIHSKNETIESQRTTIQNNEKAIADLESENQFKDRLAEKYRSGIENVRSANDQLRNETKKVENNRQEMRKHLESIDINNFSEEKPEVKQNAQKEINDVFKTNIECLEQAANGKVSDECQ